MRQKLDDIEARYRQIHDLETSITQLHEMFTDMFMLVDSQVSQSALDIHTCSCWLCVPTLFDAVTVYIKVGSLRRIFFSFPKCTHKQLRLMKNVRSHPIRHTLVCTKRCYKVDKVLEQGTLLKDMVQCYCRHMKKLL